MIQDLPFSLIATSALLAFGSAKAMLSGTLMAHWVGKQKVENRSEPGHFPRP